MANQLYLTLNTGHKMPQLGLGTWQSSPQEVEAAIEAALEAGYRHIDCAHAYCNEKEIGNALTAIFASGKVKRKEVFLTSKIWNACHSYQAAVNGLDQTLKDLQVTYLDMCLVHWPMGYKEGGELFPKADDGTPLYSDIDYLETWKALEDGVKAGKVRSIGLSNFNIAQIKRVMISGKIKPSNLQIECHPYFAQEELIKFCKDNDIVVACYSPFASPSNMFRKPGDPNLFDESSLKTLGQKYSKTVGQIILRWHIQRGTAALPKSVNRGRVKENFDVWNFNLNDDDMKVINELNRNWRVIRLERDIKHQFYPF